MEIVVAVIKLFTTMAWWETSVNDEIFVAATDIAWRQKNTREKEISRRIIIQGINCTCTCHHYWDAVSLTVISLHYLSNGATCIICTAMW